jgi:hypothetical protein
MRRNRAVHRVIVRGRAALLGVIACIALSEMVGCERHCWIELLVRGKLIDTETGDPVTEAAFGGRTFTNGEETDSFAALISDGSPTLPPTSEDGEFEIPFAEWPLPCGPPAPEFPPPDQIEVIIVRDGCEQTFLIDINEDTVVDLEFPDPVPVATVSPSRRTDVVGLSPTFTLSRAREQEKRPAPLVQTQQKARCPAADNYVVAA